MNKIVGIMLLGVMATSCSPLKKAQKHFDNGEYNEAINLYSKLVNQPKYAAESNFMIGESYRLSNRIERAAPFYNAAVNSGHTDESAELYYAYALKSQGQYNLAEEYIEKYLENAQDEELYQIATKELVNLKELDELARRPSYYEIRNTEEINTADAEYSPFVKDNRFYFTSTQGQGKIYKATGSSFSDIYVSRILEDGIDGKNVKSVGEFINTYDVNEGSIAISPNGRTMIFARGNTGKRKGTNDVNLYITTYRNNKWSEPRMMNINDPTAWNASPAFSRDGRALYFASNRNGGVGGTDIYSAHLNANGRWGNVKNMGNVINTPGNEMFPFVSESGILHFSSTGHPGYGGLDLFAASRRRGKIKVENMGKPVNSSMDDFGLFLTSPNEGYFCSNREGGKGDDDIYQFVNHDPNIRIVNYFLEGKTFTINENGQEQYLANVRIRLFDIEENLIDRATTDNEGKFLFRVDPEQDYVLIGEKPAYFTSRALYSTNGKSVDLAELTEYETDILFDTLLRLDQIILDKSIVLENIYYDLDRDEIRPDAALELDKLVAVLNDNPEIAIELSSHTDSRASDEHNLDLSQRRAESAVEYIIDNGIDASRLIAKGYGETRLITNCPNDVPCTEEEHQLNRRTEFKVTDFDTDVNQQKVVDEELEDRLFEDY